MVMAELEWMLGFPPYLESMVKNLGSCFDKPNVYAFTFFNHKLFLILNWHCWASEKGPRQETQNIAGSNNWHDSIKKLTLSFFSNVSDTTTTY